LPSKPIAGSARLEWDPFLVEEAVLLAVARGGKELAFDFHLERDPLYELAAGRARDERFLSLHKRWWERLRLGDAVERALAEVPEAVARVSRIVVLRALRANEEGADLHAARNASLDPPALVLRLRPQSVLAPETLLARLRHQLLHAADMLDPEFGFCRADLEAGSPGALSMLRQRYRCLWNVSIDGRLARTSRLEGCREKGRREELRQSLSLEGKRLTMLFARLFDGPRPTHAELLSLARLPLATAPGRGSLPSLRVS
jgi:hypothetical protein